MMDIQQVSVGDTLRVGRINVDGLEHGAGSGQRSAQRRAERQPPAKLPLTLLAMPHRRCSAAFCKHCHPRRAGDHPAQQRAGGEELLADAVSQPEVVQAFLLLGLEQARDTVLPTVRIEKRFKPFVRGQLPGIIDGKSQRWLPTPAAAGLPTRHRPATDPGHRPRGRLDYL